MKSQKRPGQYPLKSILRSFIASIFNSSSRKHKTLRECCQRVLERLKSMSVKVNSADDFCEPFLLGCACKSPKVMGLALEGMQKLIAGGYLTGKLMINKDSDGGPQYLLDHIVSSVCKCSDNSSDDVQLQVVKTVMTMTAELQEIHQRSLLLVLKACYHIYLHSKHRDLQTSASAALTQTLKYLFDRMENHAEDLKRLDDATKLKVNVQKAGYQTPTHSFKSDPTSGPSAKTPDQVTTPQSGQMNLEKDKGIEGEEDRRWGDEEEEIAVLKDKASEEKEDIDDEEEEEEEEPEETATSIVKQLVNNMIASAVQLEVEKLERESEFKAQREKNKGNHLFKQEKYEKALEAYQKAFSLHPRSPVYLINQAVVLFVLERWDQCIETCHRALRVGEQSGNNDTWMGKALSTLGSVALKRGNIPEAVNNYKQSLSFHEDPKIKRKLQDLEEDSRRIKQQKDPKYQIQCNLRLLEKDVTMVFTELCGLSVKEPAEENLGILDLAKLFNRGDEQVKTQTKVLSLRLLQSCLHSSGAHFLNHPAFIEMMREELMPALVQNAVSSVETIFVLALNIFMALLKKFRSKLKKEIGVVLDSLLLQIAMSSNFNFTQKIALLEKLMVICTDPSLLVSLFINYDCGGEVAPNVFRLLVDALEKTNNLSQNFVDRDWMTAEQADLLRMKALSCLVCILDSLVKFSGVSQGQSQQRTTHSNTKHSSEKMESLGTPRRSELSSLAESRVDGLFEAASAKRMRLDIAESTSEHSQTNSLMVTTPIQRYLDSEKHQRALDFGIVKFNMKPSSGIAYLIQNKVVTNTEEGVANFLAKTPGLSKIMLGEYLGEYKEFNMGVLRHYIFGLNFEGVPFDRALRHLCSTFKPPGEAQKVDRIMERFAERYTLQNQGAFPNADAAMILAFSVLMLNTDLHSDQIKRKMTKEEFIKSNRSISKESELSTDMLSNIFDSVQRNEIKLAWGEKHDVEINTRSRSQAYRVESKILVEKATKKISNQPIEGEEYLWPTQEPYEDPTEIIRHMYSACWMSVLATLGSTMEQSENLEHVQLCLKGIRLGIRLASILGMDVPREAFVTAVAHSTLLGSGKLINQKNISTAKLLFQVAYEEGSSMRNSWGLILQAISDFELLKLQVNNEVSDTTFFQDTEEVDKLKPQPRTLLSAANNMLTKPARRKRTSNTSRALKTFRETHEYCEDGMVRMVPPNPNSSFYLQELTEQIESHVIDRIFTVSAKLPSKAIEEFVSNLATVSRKELEDQHEPRVYSLQKLNEVASMNMHRVRMEWEKIWRVISDIFCFAGCHKNVNVSMYAIDSLKQLAAKFLEKDELSNFRFQSKFLQPFEIIMERTHSPQIRELVVRCMARIIQGRHENVKSGWRVVFTVLGRAARDTHPNLLEATHEVVSQILDVYFPLIQSITSRPSRGNTQASIRGQTRHLRLDALTEAVNTLTSLSLNVNTDNPLHAIDNLSKCAQYLFESDRCDAEFESHSSQHNINNSVINIERAQPASTILSARTVEVDSNSEEKVEVPTHRLSMQIPAIKAWYLCLRGLSQLVRDPRLNVRSRSLNVLYKLLHIHGVEFKPELWTKVHHELLYPIFNLPFESRTPPQASKPGPGSKGKSDGDTDNTLTWLNTTCFNALSQLVELFAKYYEQSGFLQGDLLELLNGLIAQTSFELSDIAVQCRTRLVELVGQRQSSAQWTILLNSFAHSLRVTLHFQPLPVTALPPPPAQAAPPTLRAPSLPKPKTSLPSHTAPLVSRNPDPELSPPNGQASLHPLLRSHLLILSHLREISLSNGQLFNLGHWQILLNSCSNSREVAKASPPSAQEMTLTPHLYTSTRVLLEVLFWIVTNVTEKDDTDIYSCAEDRLIKLCVEILDDFAEMRNSGQRIEEIVCFLLERVLKTLSDQQFRKHIKTLFPFLARLVNVESRDIRYLVFGLLIQRVHGLIPDH